MCDRTQLVPTRQVLQVGDASTISRGRSDCALKALRSWSMLLMSVSPLRTSAADPPDVDAPDWPLACSLDPHPPAAIARAMTATSAASSRLIAPPVSRPEHCGAERACAH